jgi:hypothetical protein
MIKEATAWYPSASEFIQKQNIFFFLSINECDRWICVACGQNKIGRPFATLALYNTEEKNINFRCICGEECRKNTEKRELNDNHHILFSIFKIIEDN